MIWPTINRLSGNREPVVLSVAVAILHVPARPRFGESGMADWESLEWQTHIQRLAKRHYGPGDYQEIPDTDCGDLGLEGFSRSKGHAYQCYCPQPATLDVDTRYTRYRNKISADIKKFIKNGDRLAEVLGATKICAWVFAVPVLDSRRILAHTSLKEREVREAALPYASPGFCIQVVTDDHFHLEKQQFLGAGALKLTLDVQPPPVGTIDGWASAHTDLTDTLLAKLRRLQPDTGRRNAFGQKLIGSHVAGQNALNGLRKDHPQIFETVDSCKSTREALLAIEASASLASPQDFLSEVLKKFRVDLLEAAPFAAQSAEALVWEAVADWLMRCPLDFSEAS